jgi:hypothetical protein
MRVSGFVYHAHAALTELGFNPVMAECLADHSHKRDDIHERGH